MNSTLIVVKIVDQLLEPIRRILWKACLVKITTKFLYPFKVYKLIFPQENLKSSHYMHQKVNKKCVRIRSFYHVNMLLNPLGKLSDSIFHELY